MAVFDGLPVPGSPPQRGGNGFTVHHSGGLVAEVGPLTTGATVVLTRFGSRVDQQVVAVDSMARFYDLAPGTYIAVSVYGGQEGSAWVISVVGSTPTVTAIASGGGSSPGYIVFG